jgi:myo-inositol-hexaphosphate 3-phosphohydrolase
MAHEGDSMNRLMIQAALCIVVCPLLTAQQPGQSVSTSEGAQAVQSSIDPLQPSASAERIQAIKAAGTIGINSDTVFLTVSTLDRALMQQKNRDKLGLNLVNDEKGADLEIQVNRVVFTHIHTYILTDRATGIVLASGRVRAFDGVIASGPMAEQVVKALSAVRLPTPPANAEGGF